MVAALPIAVAILAMEILVIFLAWIAKRGSSKFAGIIVLVTGTFVVAVLIVNYFEELPPLMFWGGFYALIAATYFAVFEIARRSARRNEKEEGAS